MGSYKASSKKLEVCLVTVYGGVWDCSALHFSAPLYVF